MSFNEFQEGVMAWGTDCFGEEIFLNDDERKHRFVEEALELAQAKGYTAEQAHRMVDYVFNRPVGEVYQEVGGVMVCLAALCDVSKLSMMQCGYTELARILTKKEKIREKQRQKPRDIAV